MVERRGNTRKEQRTPRHHASDLARGRHYAIIGANARGESRDADPAGLRRAATGVPAPASRRSIATISS